MLAVLQVPFIEPREIAAVVDQWARAEAKAVVPEAAKASYDVVVTSGQALVVRLSRVAREGPAVDVAFDNRWAGLHDILTGITRFGRGAQTVPLPALARRVELATMVAATFTGPDMKWLNAPYIDEWRDGRYRLLRLDAPAEGRPTVRAALVELALQAELDAIIAVHDRLALVLGITDGVGTDLSDDVVAWNKKVNAFLVALAHHGGEAASDPASNLAGLLVRPVEDAWGRQRMRRRGRGAAPEGGEPPVEGGTTP